METPLMFLEMVDAAATMFCTSAIRGSSSITTARGVNSFGVRLNLEIPIHCQSRCLAQRGARSSPSRRVWHLLSGATPLQSRDEWLGIFRSAREISRVDGLRPLLHESTGDAGRAHAAPPLPVSMGACRVPRLPPSTRYPLGVHWCGITRAASGRPCASRRQWKPS